MYASGSVHRYCVCCESSDGLYSSETYRNCSEEKEQQTKMSGGGSGRSSFCVSESLCTTRKNRGTDHSSSSSLCFDVCGIEVRVLDDDLAEAIKYLSEKDREILLMYFFLGMSDTEIGDRLKINRSTSFRSRKNSLEEIKKKLKENMNDE